MNVMGMLPCTRIPQFERQIARQTSIKMIQFICGMCCICVCLVLEQKQLCATSSHIWPMARYQRNWLACISHSRWRSRELQRCAFACRALIRQQWHNINIMFSFVSRIICAVHANACCSEHDSMCLPYCNICIHKMEQNSITCLKEPARPQCTTQSDRSAYERLWCADPAAGDIGFAVFMWYIVIRADYRPSRFIRLKRIGILYNRSHNNIQWMICEHLECLLGDWISHIG